MTIYSSAAEKLNYIEAKPVLKWAGGKGQLLGVISQYFPSKLRLGGIKRYIEPFVGGGAVFFEIANNYHIKEAFLFDINPELVILYNVIKNDISDLIDGLEKIKKQYLASTNQAEFYYTRRDEYNRFDKSVNANDYSRAFIRRAALTIFLNKTCFNGLFRVNSKGEFNVPIGSYKNPKILDAENLLNVSQVLQDAVIMQADFEKTLHYVKKDTFIYYDPPYRPICKTSSFNSYSTESFDDVEQVRLKDVFDKANFKGALQMLSNSDPTNYTEDTFFDELYKGYNINRIMAKRMINSKAEGRAEIKELLITDYEVAL